MVDPSSIDPNTLAVAGIAAWASKDTLDRLLGPTVDYVAGRVKGLVEKCDINLGSVFSYAIKKLGPRINEPGAVNPRVLKQVWSEGAFIEDELTAEYFGGLLASARTPDGKDDRVLSLLSTVRDLSSYDLRLHHLIYALVRSCHLGTRVSLRDEIWLRRAAVYIRYPVYARQMRMEAMIATLDPALREFADQSLFALRKYDLIAEHKTSMVYEVPLPKSESVTEAGIEVVPSHLGAKLFLWAHGYSDKRIDQIFDPDIDLPSEVDPSTVPHHR